MRCVPGTLLGAPHTSCHLNASSSRRHKADTAFPIVQTGKQRLTKDKGIVQGHTFNNSQRQDLYLVWFDFEMTSGQSTSSIGTDSLQGLNGGDQLYGRFLHQHLSSHSPQPLTLCDPLRGCTWLRCGSAVRAYAIQFLPSVCEVSLSGFLSK